MWWDIVFYFIKFSWAVKLIKIFIDIVSVECDKGTYFNENANDCRPCSLGEYQDEFGKTSCKKCDADKWTASTGSVSQMDCKREQNEL